MSEIKLEKRTKAQRLTIANTLIESVICDSDLSLINEKLFECKKIIESCLCVLNNRECANCDRFQGKYGCGRYVDSCMQDGDAYSNWLPKES